MGSKLLLKVIKAIIIIAPLTFVDYRQTQKRPTIWIRVQLASHGEWCCDSPGIRVETWESVPPGAKETQEITNRESPPSPKTDKQKRVGWQFQFTIWKKRKMSLSFKEKVSFRKSLCRLKSQLQVANLSCQERFLSSFSTFLVTVWVVQWNIRDDVN